MYICCLIIYQLGDFGEEDDLRFCSLHVYIYIEREREEMGSKIEKIICF